MSRKDLGMIHTVNHFTQINASGDIANIDLSGELTNQLERLVRQGNFFKVCGIDMTLTTQGTIGGGQMSGYIRYYAPTRGRCMAYRAAYQTMRELMKSNGINVGRGSGNEQYDFRVALNDSENSNGHPTMRSQATLDGTLGLCLYNISNPEAGVFDVHNEGVVPANSVGATAGSGNKGFSTVINNSGSAVHTDFILDNYRFYSGAEDYANLNWEFIPFTLSWTPDTTDMAVKFSWEPDPALYLAVMCGLLQIKVEELNLDGSPTLPPGLELHTAISVAGWKSIMGDPDRKSNKGRKK